MAQGCHPNRKNAFSSPKRRMPTLTSLMTEELKALAIHQARLHTRRDRRPYWKSDFALAGSIEEHGLDTSLWLLPGGENVTLMSGSEEIKPCRVMLPRCWCSRPRRQFAWTIHGRCPVRIETTLLWDKTASDTCHPVWASRVPRNGCEVLQRRIQIGSLGDFSRIRGAGRRQGEISNVRTCRWRSSRWTRFGWVWL